ncbi:MAG: hypothetical protein AB1499_08350 [Nitrospirota bacterium]
MNQTIRLKNRLWTTCFFIIYFGISACSHVSIQQYPIPADKSFESSSAIEGVSAIAKPLLSRDDQLTYFGTDMMGKGILPIYLAVKNNNNEDSFILKSDSITLQSDEGNSSKDTPATEMINNSQNMMAVTAVLSPLLFIAADMSESNARVIDDNFESNKFRSKTLNPGQMASGFLYLSWDKFKDKDHTNMCFLLSNPVSDKSYPYCLNISLKGVSQ